MKDPAATVTFAGTEVVSEFAEDAGTAMGKPVYATVAKNLRVTDSREPVEALSDIVAEVEGYGWRKADVVQLPDLVLLSKALDGGRGSLRISIPSSDPSLIVFDLQLR